MAVDYWDELTRELVIDEKKYDVDTGRWVRNVSAPKTPEPSLDEAYKRWKKVVTVSQEPKTGYVTVAVEHQSPDLAKQWVEWIVRDLNELLRKQDTEQAQQAIAYLTEQVAKTPYAELQKMLFELIQSNIETTMLVNARPEYVYKVVDPAYVPTEPDSPSRAVICIQITLLGGIFSTLLVVLSYYFRRTT